MWVRGKCGRIRRLRDEAAGSNLPYILVSLTDEERESAAGFAAWVGMKWEKTYSVS